MCLCMLTCSYFVNVHLQIHMTNAEIPNNSAGKSVKSSAPAQCLTFRCSLRHENLQQANIQQSQTCKSWLYVSVTRVKSISCGGTIRASSILVPIATAAAWTGLLSFCGLLPKVYSMKPGQEKRSMVLRFSRLTCNHTACAFTPGCIMA